MPGREELFLGLLLLKREKDEKKKASTHSAKIWEDTSKIKLEELIDFVQNCSTVELRDPT